MLSVIRSSFTAAELSCNEISEINDVAEATKAHFKYHPTVLRGSYQSSFQTSGIIISTTHHQQWPLFVQFKSQIVYLLIQGQDFFNHLCQGTQKSTFKKKTFLIGKNSLLVVGCSNDLLEQIHNVIQPLTLHLWLQFKGIFSSLIYSNKFKATNCLSSAHTSHLYFKGTCEHPF